MLRARYHMRLRDRFQKQLAALASSRRWTTASRFERAAIAIFPAGGPNFYHQPDGPQLLEQEFPEYAACGVVGQIIPWHFPLSAYCWPEDRARARYREYVVLKTARVYAHGALLFAECNLQEVAFAAESSISGGAVPRRALVKHPGLDKQDRIHRAPPEVGRADSRGYRDHVKTAFT